MDSSQPATKKTRSSAAKSIKGKAPAKASKTVDLHDKLPAVDDMVAALPETVVEMLKGCKVCSNFAPAYARLYLLTMDTD
jgi:hypothetical protein